MSSTITKKPVKLSPNNLTEAQQAAINRLYGYDETLLIARMGFGKAVIGLTALTELLDEGHIKRAIIIAPLMVANQTFRQEREKWSHINPNDVAIACGTPAERKAAYKSDARIVVTNIDNVVKQRGKRTVLLDGYSKTFDAMLIDEITKFKTVGGVAFKALRNWVKTLSWRAGMTGTPIAEAGTDIYGQALLLDLGKALGTRKEGFKRTYFYPTDYEQRKWRPLPGMEKILAQRLQDLVYTADDTRYVEDLPEVVTHIIDVELPPGGRAMYDEIDHTSCIQNLDIAAANAGQEFIKKFQLAAGGLYDADGSGTVIWLSSHKEEAARALIDSLETPVIVVYQFRFELDWLRRIYPEAPVLGGQQKVKAEQFDAWNRGELPVLIMHPKSASHGLNLQNACHSMLYLSPVMSADEWAQSLARIRRRGQANQQIDRYILMTKNSVDHDVYKRQYEKANDEILQMQALRDACSD